MNNSGVPGSANQVRTEDPRGAALPGAPKMCGYCKSKECVWDKFKSDVVGHGQTIRMSSLRMCLNPAQTEICAIGSTFASPRLSLDRYELEIGKNYRSV